MKINTTFRHIECNEESRQIVEEQVRDSFAHFERAREFEISIVVAKVAPRTDYHGPTFDCRISVWAPWVSKDLFRHIEGDHFFETIHTAIQMMHRQMAKMIERQHDRKRHIRVLPVGQQQEHWMEDGDDEYNIQKFARS